MQVTVTFVVSFSSDWLKGWRVFLNQSKSVVKETKVIPDYFRQTTENYSVEHTTTGLRFTSSFFFNLREFSKPIVEHG